VDGNVIRFLFPLNTPDAVFDEALGILESSCADAFVAPPAVAAAAPG